MAQVRTCAVGFPPDSGREPGFLRRKPEERAPGAVPPGPPASWPARYSLARFGVVGRSEMVDRLLRTPCTYPDLETFFRKMLFQHIFSLENASQIGLRIPDEIAPRLHKRQPRQKLASGNERPSKPGVQGRSPGPLSPHFSGEMGTPAGQAGQRGAAPRGFETAPTTRRVRTTGDLAPGPTSGAAGRRSNPAKKEPPLWSATRGGIPRRRATLSSCFLYVCPGKAGRLALCGGRGLTPAPA